MAEATKKHKKIGPRQTIIGRCNHKILPIKRTGVMLWWCTTCNDYAVKEKIILTPRSGKQFEIGL